MYGLSRTIEHTWFRDITIKSSHFKKQRGFPQSSIRTTLPVCLFILGRNPSEAISDFFRGWYTQYTNHSPVRGRLKTKFTPHEITQRAHQCSSIFREAFPTFHEINFTVKHFWLTESGLDATNRAPSRSTRLPLSTGSTASFVGRWGKSKSKVHTQTLMH